MLEQTVRVHQSGPDAPPVDQPRLREDARRLRVAYVMSRFPKLTETFILNEMTAMEEAGVDIDVYPLLRESAEVMHPEARPFVERAHFQPFLSGEIVKANLWYVARRPRAYLGALWALLSGTWRSRRYFIGALAFFPKSALFARQMAKDGVNHIHAHFASHPAAAALVIQRLAGIPFSFTAHGSDIHRDKTMLDKKVAEAAFVVPISTFNREVILEVCDAGYERKMIVIHCGVDTDIFQPGSPGPPPPLKVLCIGTLHEVKGQSYLLNACRHLRADGLDVICHLVGDGPDRAMLQAQAGQSDLRGAVRFHGLMTRAEVTELLQAVDVVVAPSVPSRDGRREGIPVALMEAMACSVPVVASRLSGIPELVIDEETGLLTTPGDVDALAYAIRRLYEDPSLRARLGITGRAKIVGDFDLRANAGRLANRFRETSQR